MTDNPGSVRELILQNIGIQSFKQVIFKRNTKTGNRHRVTFIKIDGTKVKENLNFTFFNIKSYLSGIKNLTGMDKQMWLRD